MRPPLPIALALTLLCVASAASLAADPQAAASRNSGDAPASDGRTGRQIYDEVLANRFRATRQNARLVSGDRSGNALESRMTVLWKSFRDANDDATASSRRRCCATRTPSTCASPRTSLSTTRTAPTTSSCT